MLAKQEAERELERAEEIERLKKEEAEAIVAQQTASKFSSHIYQGPFKLPGTS